jgi:hypothetical protein
VKESNYAAGSPILTRDRNDGDLKLPFAIGCAHLCNPRLGLIEGGPNWLDHVAVANDVEQGRSGRDGRLAVQFLESRIANQNVLGGVNHQQTIRKRGKDRTHFGRIFRNLAVERALPGQQLFQSQPDPTDLGGATQKKGRGLFASPNSR